MLTCCKLGALDFIILLRFIQNRIIQTRIFLYVCTTLAAVAAAVAPAEPAAATPPPRRPPPPRPSPPWSPPPRPPPPRKLVPSPPRGQAASASAPKIQTNTFCTGVVSEIQIVVNLDFLGCQHWNEQLRFFKILEYTGRYGFPEILIEVRAAFLELALRKNVRRMCAECSQKAKKKLRTVSE